MVITMPHVAMLILHERFCAINSTDHSMVICVEEARQVLTIVYMLFSELTPDTGLYFAPRATVLT